MSLTVVIDTQDQYCSKWITAISFEGHFLSSHVKLLSREFGFLMDRWKNVAYNNYYSCAIKTKIFLLFKNEWTMHLDNSYNSSYCNYELYTHAVSQTGCFCQKFIVQKQSQYMLFNIVFVKKTYTVSLHSL